jgi:hypothetical protein
MVRVGVCTGAFRHHIRSLSDVGYETLEAMYLKSIADDPVRQLWNWNRGAECQRLGLGIGSASDQTLDTDQDVVESQDR